MKVNDDTVYYISASHLRLPHGQESRSTGDLTKLAASIRLLGVMKPLTITHDDALDLVDTDVPAVNDGRFVITSGARRWAAAQMAGLQVVPCQIFGG